MRSLDIRLAAAVVGVSSKWVDNLLFQSDLPGVERGQRGVLRRVTEDGLLAIELVRLLTFELGLPVRAAARIAAQAAGSRTPGSMRVDLTSGITVEFQVAEIQARLRHRILDAVDATVPIRRGRPPRRSTKTPTSEE